MGIVVESKTVVSHIICAVLRPCHRAQGKNGDCRILRPSLALIHKSIQLRCNLPWILGRGKFIAEILNKIAQALYLLLVWSLVDTVNKGWRFGLQRLGYIMGHLSVCKEHKLLYKPVGLLCNLFHHIQRLAVTIYNNLHLRPLKRDGALRKPLCAHNGGQFVQFKHCLPHLRLHCLLCGCSLYYLLRLLVREALVGLYDRSAKPSLYNLCLCVHLKYCREGELLLSLSKRAEVVGEHLRQHWHGSVYKIDRGAPLIRLLVQNISRTHIVGNICNVHSHLKIAALQSAERERIVKILGICRVYGKGADISEIPPARNLIGSNLYRNCCSGALNSIGKLIRKTILCQNGVHLCIVLSRHTQHIHYLSPRGIISALPAVYKHCHLLPLILSLHTLQRNLHIVWHYPALYNYPSLAANNLQNTHIRLFGAL